jgi:hypothetical protein
MSGEALGSLFSGGVVYLNLSVITERSMGQIPVALKLVIILALVKAEA